MRVKYLIPFLVFVLVFGFTSLTSCKAEEIIEEPVEKEIVEPIEEEIIEEEVVEEPIEEEVVKPTEEEIKDYIGRIVVIGLKVSESTVTFGQSCLDVGDGKISTSKNKEDASNFIKDINDCYNIYLSLKVPENFDVPHELMGTAMDHFINATIYLQQYIDTENIGDMAGYLSQAISEINTGHEYFAKATEQYDKLAPEPEEEIIEESIEEEQLQEPEKEIIVEEPAEEEPIKEEPKQAQYCGSINSDVYHYPSCGSAKRINPENLIWFIDANDAKSKGYRPCKKCNPPG